MGEFKGTKGFWRTREAFDEEHNQPVIEIDCGEDVLALATIWSGNIGGNDICDEAKADALLMSKAPEMLEMLSWFVKEFTDIYHEGTEIDNKVKEATRLIKQATEL